MVFNHNGKCVTISIQAIVPVLCMAIFHFLDGFLHNAIWLHFDRPSFGSRKIIITYDLIICFNAYLIPKCALKIRLNIIDLSEYQSHLPYCIHIMT